MQIGRRRLTSPLFHAPDEIVGEEKPRSQDVFCERGLDADEHRSEVQLQPQLNFAWVVS
jgi:hypothetical protein